MVKYALFFPYLVGLSFVTMLSTQKPTNKGCSGILGEWNISDASVGTEELAHFEMICTIVYQLTRNMSMEELKASGFDVYYVDHTAGLWPQAASGVPFSAATFQSTGDPIADLTEDLAAEQKARITYDNILRLCEDSPEVKDAIRFLREREIVHFQRFGESLRIVQDHLDSRNFYIMNPAFDTGISGGSGDCGCKSNTP